MGSTNPALSQVSSTNTVLTQYYHSTTTVLHCHTLTMGDSTRLIAIITALFFPPISVLLVRGCGCDLLINILLTLAFAVPGMIHAFWIVLRDDSASGEGGGGGGRQSLWLPLSLLYHSLCLQHIFSLF